MVSKKSQIMGAKPKYAEAELFVYSSMKGITFIQQ